jgi:hypothetical protein
MYRECSSLHQIEFVEPPSDYSKTLPPTGVLEKARVILMHIPIKEVLNTSKKSTFEKHEG